MDQADLTLFAPPEDLREEEFRENARRRKASGRALLEANEVYEQYLVKTALVRSSEFERRSRVKVDRVQDVFPFLQHLQDAAEEHAVGIFLNLHNELVAIHETGKGGRKRTTADPETVVKVALLAGAESVIIAHNHPAGSPHPSAADFDVLDATRRQCSCLRLELVDALVVASDGVASLSARVYLDWNGKVVGKISKYPPKFRRRR
jgi:DNA repair protein RadC